MAKYFTSKLVYFQELEISCRGHVPQNIIVKISRVKYILYYIYIIYILYISPVTR